ncbi:MAG: hypothetical protein M1481_00085 [Candidatus Thermoplasmatota archaeon]|jgi:hypothetical protein|nr:hypothetical protein [Candidatus Thermoplasmatota archaeon]MCL5963867.1 hypothetical protein [Candidatus Thermoplasmatota archaeon]
MQSKNFIRNAARLEAFGVGLYESFQRKATEYWKEWLRIYLPMERNHWRIWNEMETERHVHTAFYKSGILTGKILSIFWGPQCILTIKLIEKFAVKGYRHVSKDPALSGDIRRNAERILKDEIDMDLMASKR